MEKDRFRKAINRQPDTKIIQTVSILALPFVWIGYVLSLYHGNSSNISSYSFLILILSVLNQDVFFKGERVSNKALDLMAKAESVLFCIWVFVMIVQLILK